MSDGRQIYIDNLRVLGTYSVILLHVTRPFDVLMFVPKLVLRLKETNLIEYFEYQDRFISQWVIPLFFWIAGFSISYQIRVKKAIFSSLFHDRILRLVIPFLTALILVCMPLSYLFLPDNEKITFLKQCILFWTSINHFRLFHMWFMPILFLVTFYNLPFMMSFYCNDDPATRIPGNLLNHLPYSRRFLVALSGYLVISASKFSIQVIFLAFNNELNSVTYLFLVNGTPFVLMTLTLLVVKICNHHREFLSFLCLFSSFCCYLYFCSGIGPYFSFKGQSIDTFESLNALFDFHSFFFLFGFLYEFNNNKLNLTSAESKSTNAIQQMRLEHAANTAASTSYYFANGLTSTYWRWLLFIISFPLLTWTFPFSGNRYCLLSKNTNEYIAVFTVWHTFQDWKGRFFHHIGALLIIYFLVYISKRFLNKELISRFWVHNSIVLYIFHLIPLIPATFYIRKTFGKDGYILANWLVLLIWTFSISVLIAFIVSKINILRFLTGLKT